MLKDSSTLYLEYLHKPIKHQKQRRYFVCPMLALHYVMFTVPTRNVWKGWYLDHIQTLKYLPKLNIAITELPPIDPSAACKQATNSHPPLKLELSRKGIVAAWWLCTYSPTMSMGQLVLSFTNPQKGFGKPFMNNFLLSISSV